QRDRHQNDENSNPSHWQSALRRVAIAPVPGIGSSITQMNDFVRYVSTRDPQPDPRTLSFEEALLAGLAADGGLYVPDPLPELGVARLRAFLGMPYVDLAAQLIALFAGDSFSSSDLRRFAERAYCGFRHGAVAPLVQIDERLWLLELFHGPTLA